MTDGGKDAGGLVIPQKWYHVRLKRKRSGFWGKNYYFIDLDIPSLIKSILIPLESQSTLFLDGRETPVGDITQVQIIEVDVLLHPSVKNHIYYTSIPGYIRGEEVFKLERDVTNYIIHEFRRSVQWGQVKGLLEQEHNLKQQLAMADADAERDEINLKLAEVIEQIVRFAGVFLAGYSKY